jgi:hypothetical protein
MTSADIHVSSGASIDTSNASNAATLCQRGPDKIQASAVVESDAHEYAGAAAGTQAARSDHSELSSDEYAIIGGFAECVLM